MNKCLLCKNKSYISIKFTKKNKIYKLNLCKNCCESFNIIFKKGKNRQIEKCPFCGYTLKEVKEYGFLGCSFCYECFNKEVINYLDKTRINRIYKGKYPKEFKKEEKIKRFFELKGYLIDEIKLNGEKN